MKNRIKQIICILVTLAIGCSGFAQTYSTKIALTGGYPTVAVKTKIEKNVSGLLDELKQAYDENLNSLNLETVAMDDSGIYSLAKIWRDVKFFCPVAVVKELLLKVPGGYQLRNIPITTESGQKQMAINFDEKGIISNFVITVEDAVYKSIMAYKNVQSKNQVREETRKKIILKFLDEMNTAYITGDADFINKLYSDDALIIVGHSLQKSESKTMQLSDPNREVFYAPDANKTVYTRLTKPEYIERLNNIFRGNKIQLGFSNIEVNIHPKEGFENLYGVKLKQHWESWHLNKKAYEDNGYLFLAIQFRKEDEPVICIRTWQDARTTDINDRIDFSDFKIQ